MLYSINNYESKKERNFYTKIFSGCIFNELLSQYKSNSKGFIDCIQISYDQTLKFLNIQESESIKTIINTFYDDVENENIKVSFDYHHKNDAAETADILIIGLKSFIAIEAKLYEDWNFSKDILQNIGRIKTLSSNSGLIPLQILLISKSKWQNALKKQSHQNSNYTKLKEYYTSPERNKENIDFIIMFWEDISNFIENDFKGVSKYINQMLKKTEMGIDCII